MPAQLVFSWGGNPGVGSLHRFRDAVQSGWPVPLELDEHSHAGMAAALRGGSGEPSVRRPPRLHRHAAGRADGLDRERHLPLHGRGAGGREGAPPRRRRHPRPAGGRGGERPDVGHHRRPEGGRARLAAGDRDGRGDRSGARAAAGRRRHPRRGRSTRCASLPAGHTPPTPTTTTTATTPSIVEWDAISSDRDVFLDWMRRHVLETADVDEYHASLQVAA